MQTITITLTVKEGTGAREVILSHLNQWFTEGPHDPPYPAGALLHYSIPDDI